VGKGKSAQDADNEFMNEFFQDVGAIKTAMSNVRRNIKLVEEKYVQSLTSVNIDQGNSIHHLSTLTSISFVALPHLLYILVVITFQLYYTSVLYFTS
jgi:hypothetical protein